MTVPMFIRMSVLALTLGASLTGCGSFRGPGSDTFKPYVPDVVQGNFVSREQREYLRSGMTRAQVRDILGTPLITSVFHADRWDYAFAIRRQGVAPQHFRLTLHFDNDVLVRLEGDDLPSEAEFAQRLSRPGPKARPPALQASEEQLRKYPPARPETSVPAPSAPLPASYPPLDSAPR